MLWNVHYKCIKSNYKKNMTELGSYGMPNGDVSKYVHTHMHTLTNACTVTHTHVQTYTDIYTCSITIIHIH